MKFTLTAQTQTNERKMFPYKKRIGTCMTHRSDIIWIDITETAQDILALIKSHSEFQYFPVCAGKIDTVIGILNARDYLQASLETPVTNLQKLLQKPVFIPETLTVTRALGILKQHKSNSACIIDEYGGIEGFITKNGLLTLLLEESVNALGGSEQTLLKQADGAVIISGQISLDEVQSLHILEDIERTPNEEYYTLAGYLLTLTDAIPQQGDVIDTGSYLCTVVGMNGQRIEQVSIKKKTGNDKCHKV